jgi:hypothetical protein
LGEGWDCASFGRRPECCETETLAVKHGLFPADLRRKSRDWQDKIIVYKNVVKIMYEII